MTFSAAVQPATGRGPARNLTKTEIKLAWKRIRSAAADGNLQASALLIALAENKPVIGVESSLVRA